jgi:hypothetical protein
MFQQVHRLTQGNEICGDVFHLLGIACEVQRLLIQQGRPDFVAVSKQPIA